MQYPLGSRWQGAMIAPALAATVVQQITGAPLEDSLAAAGKVAIHWADVLAQSGQWERALPPPVALPSPPFQSNAGLGEDAVPGAAAIAMLPLILFFHENRDQLHHALSQTLPAYGCPGDTATCVGVFAAAIAHLLHPSAAASPLLPVLLSGAAPLLPTAAAQPLWLQQVHALEQNRGSLSAAITALASYPPESAALGLALYCFLSTPTDLGLALRRAARCPHGVSVCALTGALSGAAYSYTSIPLVWQLPRDQPLSWGISAVDLCVLTRQLFAKWSGAQPHLANDFWGAAIAAPCSRT
jgi:hypothetical protein